MQARGRKRTDELLRSSQAVALTARFLPNLRLLTIEPSFRQRLRPGGYLAAPAYLTAALEDQARRLRPDGRLVIADNGLFDDIGSLAQQFTADAETINTALVDKRAELNRPVRREDLSQGVLDDASNLARRTADAAEAVDPQAHLVDQLGISPTGVVGIEDITAALWLRLGLDSRLVSDRRTELARRNANVAARAATVIEAGATDGATYLPVASALDYDTAFDAGQAFAAAGLRAAAMGFGAYMADDSYVDTVKVRGRWRRLPGSVPQRYLGTALAARGFWDGWREERGSAPGAFHFLGLGAPIMIAVVTVAARGTPVLTFDATSPIRDASEATIYASKPAYLKIRTWSAAEQLASGARDRWECPCGFCTDFADAFPFDYDAGTQWFAGRTQVVATDLRPGGGLYEAYPLLTTSSGDARARALEVARVGHNHWVLERITSSVRRNAETRTQLEAHVDQVVAAYELATNSSTFARATRLSFDIARGAWP
jgi:hypothetical protein